ncbi:hypothetical protein N322_08222, partial [Cariama cristata]
KCAVNLCVQIRQGILMFNASKNGVFNYFDFMRKLIPL